MTARRFRYGVSVGDQPLPRDWDGTGTDSPAVVRRGTWHLCAARQPFVVTGTTITGS